MPPSPKGKPKHADEGASPDRTSAVVAGGMALLAVTGVLTVFSGPLMALVTPAAPDPAGARELPGAPPGSSRATAANDAGTSTPLGRGDGAAHSRAPGPILDRVNRPE